MTTPRRVQRHRQADAARRKVRTTGTHRIGTRTRVPQQKRPTSRRPKGRAPRYRGTTAMTGLSGVLSALAFATGSVFWAFGAVTTAAGTAAVARIEYRRELVEVKRTGRPVGATSDPAPAARRTDDLEEIVEPEPVDRSTSTRRSSGVRRPAGGDHASRCTAKSPSTCRCVDGPNRKGKTTTKRATGARRKT